ncbi:MAG: hypothetical protein ACREVH_13965 [Gammaproteobacteria bacterium]
MRRLPILRLNMDAIRSSFEYAFGKVMGQAVGGLLVWTALLVFIAVFLLILYLVIRSKGVGFNIKFVSGDKPGVTPMEAPAAFSAPPASVLLGHYATPPDPLSERKALLKTLDSAEQVVARIYIGLLYLVSAAATFAMAWIYFKYPDDGNRDFMLFYGGGIYLLGMLGLSTQISRTKRRLRGRSSEPTLVDELRSKVQINVQSVPDVGFIDAASLDRARRHVSCGGTLDEACALVDPRYQRMSGWSKDVFRRAVEMSLGSSR